jgi:hypothetical protein
MTLDPTWGTTSCRKEAACVTNTLTSTGILYELLVSIHPFPSLLVNLLL